MNLDADILLWINGHYCAWADTLMWYISHPMTWLPMYVLLMVILIIHYRSWKAMLLIILGFVLALSLSDIVCSSVLKPLVCRLRPTHEPALDPLHLVNGYVGGRYGFCSSHAANTMTCGLLFSLLYRNKIATAALMVWVALNCYSRMYLGAHYPGDIIVGLLVGALWAVLVFLALRRLLPAVGAVVRQGDS